MVLEEFKEVANIKHHYKYSYEDTIYVNKSTKISVTCPLHGKFSVYAFSHLNGSNCNKCAIAATTIKVRESSLLLFKERAALKFKGKYTYRYDEFKTMVSKITITCPIHGEALQSPIAHLKGVGCRECGNTVISTKRLLTLDKFITKSNAIHNGKYAYTKTEYKNTNTKLIIICPIHGDFTQAPRLHYKGGCKECGTLKMATTNTHTTVVFTAAAKLKFGGTYSYDNVLYEHNTKKVSITCRVHGDFSITPTRHLLGGKCPVCVHGGEQPSTLYYFEINKVYKLGITSLPFDVRYGSTDLSNMRNISLLSVPTRSQAFQIEQHLLEELAEFRYYGESPFISKLGTTECFKEDVLKTIKEIINVKFKAVCNPRWEVFEKWSIQTPRET